jgi:hypothetical protein
MSVCQWVFLVVVLFLASCGAASCVTCPTPTRNAETKVVASRDAGSVWYTIDNRWEPDAGVAFNLGTMSQPWDVKTVFLRTPEPGKSRRLIMVSPDGGTQMYEWRAP